MPILLALLALTLLFLMLIVTIPLGIVQRYRQGTRRRKARGWVVSLNLGAAVISCVMFLTSAAILNFSAPDAFVYSLIGLAVGGCLGLVGLLIARWEHTDDALHYTPSRILILFISIVVTARIAYGIFRAWNAWGAAGDESWFAAAGISNSLAFGAVVIGYYLTFWAGIRGRIIRRKQR